MKIILKQPYKVFFTIGFALSISLILIWLLSGCGMFVAYRGDCISKIAYCATTMANLGYETQIVEGPSTLLGSSATHCQSRAKVNDKWEWLEMVGYDVVVGRQHRFEPDFTKTYTLIEFLDRWIFRKQRAIEGLKRGVFIRD